MKTLLVLLAITLLISQWVYSQETLNDPFWQEMIRLPRRSVTALLVDTLNYIFASTDPGGVFVSSDNGITWNARNDGLLGTPCFALALGDSNHVYVTTHLGLYRTTNQGISWVVMGPFGVYPGSVAINSRGYIFVGEKYFTSGDVFRSTDKGATWTYVELPRSIPYALTVNASDHVFAGTSNGIFRTTNDGATWDSISTGLTTRGVWDIEVDRNGVLYAGIYLGGVFRSTNNGDTWSFAGLLGEDVLSLAINSRGHVFAGTTNHGVFVSLDYGESWSAENSGLADTVVSALAFDRNGFAFAGSSPARVYRSVNSTTSVAPSDSDMPEAIHLEQNYPNPFNPTTRIEYSIPKSSHVSLKVLDLLGRGVATIVDEVQDAGVKSADFKAAGLASGAYFYRLGVGGFVKVKKMMVIR